MAYIFRDVYLAPPVYAHETLDLCLQELALSVEQEQAKAPAVDGIGEEEGDEEGDDTGAGFLASLTAPRPSSSA